MTEHDPNRPYANFFSLRLRKLLRALQDLDEYSAVNTWNLILITSDTLFLHNKKQGETKRSVFILQP